MTNRTHHTGSTYTGSNSTGDGRTLYARVYSVAWRVDQEVQRAGGGIADRRAALVALRTRLESEGMLPRVTR